MEIFKNKNIKKMIVGVLFISFCSLVQGAPAATATQGSETLNAAAKKAQISNLTKRLDATNDPKEIYVIGNTLFMQGNLEMAEKAFTKGKSAPENLMGLATTQRFLRNYVGAAKNYTTLIEMKYNLGESYFGRGLAYRGQEEFSKAIDDMKSSLNYRKDEYTYAGIGDLLILVGRSGEARVLLEEGKIMYPNSELIKKIIVRSYKN